MNFRLPPELQAVLADMEPPPADATPAQRIAFAERAYEGAAAHLGDGEPLLADLAECLWVEYCGLEDWPEVEKQLLRMVHVLGRPDAAPSHKLGMAFKRLAGLRMLQQAWEDTLAVARQGIEAFTRAGMADDVQAGKLRFLMSNAYRILGDDAASRTVLRESLPALRSDESGHGELASVLKSLAWDAMDEGDMGEALSLLTEAMRVLPRTVDNIGQNCALSLMMGRCLMNVGRYSEALAILEPLVRTLESLFATELPDTIEVEPSLLPRALDHLGQAQLGMGQNDEARASFERALRTGEAVHGRNSSKLAEIHGHLQLAHRARGDHKAAERAASRAVAMYERTGIKDGPLLDALWDLAECHIATKQFDKADAIAQRLGKLAESSAGPTGPHVGQILGLRGRIQFGRRKYRAALTLLERALSMLDAPEVPKIQYLQLSRIAAEIRLFHQPIDENVKPALERQLQALKRVTEEVEETNARVRYGLGLTPRSERS